MTDTFAPPRAFIPARSFPPPPGWPGPVFTGHFRILKPLQTPMQEALAHGGRYILVHPEVLNQLKQNSIDPFLVYEAALRIEIESSIPQIDLIGANVDHVLKAWTGKPASQAPLHARQVLWLEENAPGLGYERSGNSWLLK